MYAQVNGIRLYYEKAGEGPPVVVLHGNGETHEIFDVLTGSLSRTHTVYALDSRGHGRSGGGEKLSYDEMARDVALLIEELKLNRPALYGFSDGGIIGLLLAIRCPGLLSRLAVSGANAAPEGLNAWARTLFRLNYWVTRSPRVWMMLTQPHITAEELGRIDIPVLVLAGEKDLIREQHTRWIAQSIPNSQMKILRGQGHGTYVVHSGKLYPMLRDFLEE